MTSVIRNAAKAGEPDRYLAALLAPAAARDDLVVLAAFLAETGRVGMEVRDPLVGEIRLQWWRDALEGGRAGHVSGNPIADAFAAVIVRHGLSPDAINGLLDAHVHALFPDPPPSIAALSQELKLREGAAFQFAAQILGMKSEAASIAVCDNAGITYGLARLGLRLPYAMAFGRMPLPPEWIAANETDMRAAMVQLIAGARAHLQSVKRAWHGVPQQLKTALLPVALVEPYLGVLEKAGHDAAHDVGDVSPLGRVGRLAFANVRGRL